MANVMTRLAIASLLSAICGCNTQANDVPGGGTDCSTAPPDCYSQCMCATGDANFCAGACPQSAVTGTLPCDIDNVVKQRCQTCHGPRPIGGAPMSLVTEADFQRDYTVHTTVPLMGQTLKLYQLARIRINGQMGTPKMPQGNPLSPGDFSALDSWLGSNAPAGLACGAPPPPPGGGGYTGAAGSYPGTGSYTNVGGYGAVPNGAGGYYTGTGAVPGGGGYVGAGSTPGSGSAVGAGSTPGAGGGVVGPPPVGNVITPNTPDQCANDPTQFDTLVAQPGETCYDFPVHGASSPTDTSKFTVQPGQSYNQFYYNVPWPPGTIATRFGAKFDNLQVLHHWLGFSITSGGAAAGTVQTNVTGTTLGQGAELIGGWAVGGCNVVFTPDVGLKLPDSGQIMVQWHHYNSTGAPAQDGTRVQFCTMPASARQHLAGLTFLGTENFNGLAGMPAGQTSKFSGTCPNNSGGPITIVGYTPHMHLLGTNMTSVVTHSNGQSETVFDHPFLFDHQVNYILNPGYVLQPGDKITSTCTFDNTTSAPVAFGQSTKQEMCYQFTISWPYNALNNHVVSLIGATNTCW